MGSLYSKPKIPAAPVYYTAPAPEPAPAPAPESGEDAERAARAVRRRTLPETILTSFRGVLSPGAWAPQRKSLLGE